MNLVPRKFFVDDFWDDFSIKTTNDFKYDIYEKNNNYYIEIDAPGVKKEEATIEYDKGYLTIMISQSKEEEDEGKNYIRRERYAREYNKQFYIGEIDSEKIDVKFKDGSIKIEIPKAEINSTKKIINIK